jgi:hypothetical protein
MWKSRLFGSLPLLLDFVNEHELGAHQFKVVVVPPRAWQRRGNPRYYLIYRTEAPDPELVGSLASTAEDPLAIDEAAAIDTAAEIIASAQHRGGHGPGEPGA